MMIKQHFRDVLSFLFSKDLNFIEALILAALLLWVFWRDLGAVEFQPDETFWISSSARFDEFLAGDFDSPVWTEPFINYDVRPVPSYIVAISQRVGGIQSDDLPLYWNWALTESENVSRGAMPSERTIWWSRLPMAIISVFTLMGTIILIAKAHSRVGAYIFALISFNDYFLLHLRRAMSEAPLLLFTVLTLYASYKLLTVIRHNHTKMAVLWSVIAGILCGLAGQSKLTGLSCMAIPTLAAFLLIFRSPPRRQMFGVRRFLMVVSIVLFTSLLVFVASYPFFYRDTLYRAIGTFYFRNAVIQGQEEIYPSQVILPEKRVNILFERIFEYPVKPASNGTVGSLFHGINLLLVAFGVTYSVIQIWKRAEGWENFAILLIGALTCAVPMLFVPFDWDRYYLYPIFFSCIFFSIGMSQLFFIGVLRIKTI